MNEGLKDRLFKVMFNYKATPGVALDDNFNDDTFKKWLAREETWQKIL